MKRGMLVSLAMSLFAAAAAGRVREGDLLAGVRPGPDGRIDVVAIFPHQDDETIFAGGTLVKLKQDPRVRTHVICLTLGDLSSAKDRLGISGEELGRIRSSELVTAATALRVDETIQLQYHDQGLAGLDQAALTQEVLGLLERTGAEVVITYGPDGLTGHPDHQAGSRATTEAFRKSPAQKLYYVSLPRSVSLVYYFFSHQLPRPATVKVDIRPVKKQKKLALCDLGSQRNFNGWPEKIEMSNYLDHEWFALAAENP